MTHILWFTGLSGSGKSTIADKLKRDFESEGKKVLILDGDVVREKLHKHLGFSREDIKENNRLIAELAKKEINNYDLIIIPVISPYIEDRKMAKEIIGDSFIEVFANRSIESCIKNDVKGLYKKALAGEIKNFIGIAESNPYESPKSADIELYTDKESVDESVKKINTFLRHEKELSLAKELSVLAGKKIMEYYKKEFRVENKVEGERTSQVTIADKEANEIIVTSLRKHFPDYGILTEEEVDNFERLNKKYIWIIDPLDGTKEFINGSDDFTVNIALVHNNRPILGVIYVPAKNELYYASKLNGAFVVKDGNKTKINVSNRNKTENMIVVHSKNHETKEFYDFIDRVKFKESIPAGSSVKGCRVATGEADVYLRYGPMNEWDVCAMNIIVEEAGGFMTDLKGTLIKYNQKVTLLQGFLVSNSKIHKELLKLI